MLHAALKLRLPQMPKSSMSNSKKVHEGKHTKGTLAKGHLCAYPTFGAVSARKLKSQSSKARGSGPGIFQ